MSKINYLGFVKADLDMLDADIIEMKKIHDLPYDMEEDFKLLLKDTYKLNTKRAFMLHAEKKLLINIYYKKLNRAHSMIKTLD